MTRGPSTAGSPAGRSTTPCCGSGCAPPGCRVCSPGWTPAAVTAGLGTGVATVALPADPVAVAAAHAAVHAAGGTSVLRSRPVGLDAPTWGPAPSALAVLRAVKQELDPAGRLGPGRFAPWLTARSPTSESVSQRPCEAPTEPSEGVQ